MTEPEDFDGRVARLQRAAYGSGVPDREREAAAAELESLRSSREERTLRRIGAEPPGRAGAGGDSAPGRPGTTPAGHDDPPGAAPHDDADLGGDPSSASARRTLVVASAIALLTGLAAGWTLGASVSQGDDAEAVPTSETVAWRVFDAPVPNGDRVRYPAPPVGVDLDRDSRRLLAARSDGVRVVAVRSEDGRDACLVLVVPSGPSAAECTADGRFPAGGLEVRTVQPGTGTFSATWDATGRVSLGPADADG